MTGRFGRILLWVVGAVLALAAAFFIWVYTVTYHPEAVESEAVIAEGTPPPLSAGGTVKVLSWNVQFMAGNRDNQFFYSGGTDPWPGRARIVQTVTEVADVIRQEDPDIVLLQEVDVGAERTHFTDQVAMLLERLPDTYRAHSKSYYWKADFVPHPDVMGAVGMTLVTISKYAIDDATRYALPAITSDDILRRQFNLKRAILAVDMPIAGGGALTVLNTHLSAFAPGDDTMARQIARVAELLGDLQAAGRPWLIGGDFNLLPSTDGTTEIAPLMREYLSVPSMKEATGPDKVHWFTHMSADDPDRAPDKTIDYIFYSDTLKLGAHAVRLEGTRWISDHLPVIATFALPDR